MTPKRKRPDPTLDEVIEWQLTRIAKITTAIRKLANHVHRLHSEPRSRVSWPNCPDPWCKLAHDAVEGPIRTAEEILTQTQKGKA